MTVLQTAYLLTSAIIAACTVQSPAMYTLPFLPGMKSYHCRKHEWAGGTIAITNATMSLVDHIAGCNVLSKMCNYRGFCDMCVHMFADCLPRYCALCVQLEAGYLCPNRIAVNNYSSKPILPTSHDVHLSKDTLIIYIGKN